MTTNPLLNTTHSTLTLLPRILAGGPLLMFGFMHLSGAMPMKPLVEAAALPMPDLAATVTPIVMVLAGLMLLAGALVRLGALAAIGSMLGALMTHIKIPNDQWPTPSAADPSIIVPGPEPTFMMALAVLIILSSAYLLFKGAGAMSLDAKLTGARDESNPSTDN